MEHYKRQLFGAFLFSVMDGDSTLLFETLKCNKDEAQQTSTGQRVVVSSNHLGGGQIEVNGISWLF